MSSLEKLAELSRTQWAEYLDKYAGTKALVWDQALTGPLDLIAKYQFLREREVTKMFPLKSGRLPASSVENIVFITRPETSLMKIVAENVKKEENSGGGGQRTEFHILFVPHRSLLCDSKLKDLGVYGSFTYMDELPIIWFPLETDVISMERSSIFREYHLEEDSTCLNLVAKGLINLQAVYGVIPNVYGKGKAAKQVYDYMSKLRKEMIGEEPEQMSEIDNLIIIDRQIDLITPLSTQLTYEGLIDEMFGIRFNTVKLPANRFIAADATESGEGSSASSAAAAGESNPFETEKKTILLNSSEDLYTEIRDKNFNGVGPALSAKAKYVSSQRDVMQGSQTVKELRMFVDRMPLLEAMKQSVATHTCIAEMIKEQTDNRKFLDNLQVEQEFLNFQNTDRPHDYLEEAALWGIELPRLLRTMCLQSVVNSGLKPKVLNAYRKELVCEAYGHKHMITLQNLEKVGLLTAQSANRNYAVLRKRLNLTMDDVNEQEPSDIAYVHSVYAPLSIRLIQNFFQPGWKSIRDVLDLLPGPTVDEKQALLPVVAANSGDGRLPSYQRHYENPTIECGGMKKTLVVFVGGCTYAEISALRFLSTHEDSNSEYLIATTSVINGTSFIESVMTDIPDAMDPRDG